MTAGSTGTARDRPVRPLLGFVLLTYGTSWLLWLPVLRGVGGAAATVLVTAGAFGPAVAAGLVVWWSGGSVGAWLRPLLRWRVPVRYWICALGLPVVLFGSVDVVLAVLGRPVHLDRLGPSATSWLVVLVWAAPLAALQEELGWRGFALDRLQARCSPLVATVLLGLMWGLWHLPFDGLGVLGPALLAVPFTWLWNRTGSLLLCSVLHAAVVASQDHLVLTDSGAPAASPAILGVLLVGAVALVVATRGRLGFDQRPGPVAARVADTGPPADDGPAG